MSINRIHRKKSGFSIILNEGANDDNLSWAARGVLWHFLTKPDGWTIYTKELVKRSNSGIKGVTSILHELEEKGYLVRWCDRGKKGQLEWRSEVFESKSDRQHWIEENTDLLQNALRLSRGTAIAVNPEAATESKNSTIPPLGVDGSIPPSSIDGQTMHGSTINGQEEDIVNNDPSQYRSNQLLNQASPPTPQGGREGADQKEDFKAEELDQSPSVPCQRSAGIAARMEDAHETSSSAAPQKTQPEEKLYFDPTGDRFNAGASLPIWRAKRGPNGWNEEFLEIFIEQNKKDFEEQGWTRRKAIAFIVNNESPGSPKHETLMGYVDEVQKELDRRNARISQPSIPTTRYQAMTPEQEEERRQFIASQKTSAPPEVRRQFDEIRARARQKQEQESARRDRWAHLPQQA